MAGTAGFSWLGSFICWFINKSIFKKQLTRKDIEQKYNITCAVIGLLLIAGIIKLVKYAMENISLLNN